MISGNLESWQHRKKEIHYTIVWIQALDFWDNDLKWCLFRMWKPEIILWCVTEKSSREFQSVSINCCLLFGCHNFPFIIIIIIIIIPYLHGLLGHHSWLCNQFSPFLSVLHCPLRLAKLQACPFPHVVFSPLPMSALSSSPFHCALQDGFGQTCLTGDMTISLQFASL